MTAADDLAAERHELVQLGRVLWAAQDDTTAEEFGVTFARVIERFVLAVIRSQRWRPS